jgi:hypothetical protein
MRGVSRGTICVVASRSDRCLLTSFTSEVWRAQRILDLTLFTGNHMR